MSEHHNLSIETIKNNVYLTVLRDIVQPIAVAFITLIGGWFMQDHLALRTDTIIQGAQITALETILVRDEERLSDLERLSLANATDRFTDEDGEELERRLSRQIQQVDQRLTRVEDRINGQ